MKWDQWWKDKETTPKTGIGASLTPDFRDQEESNDNIIN